MISPGGFSVARLPRIVFGAGRFADLPRLVSGYGRRALLVTGNKSLRNSARWPQLLDALKSAGVEVDSMSVEGEPSPHMVDKAVAAFERRKIEVVVGIGGGSALDAAKAIAGLLIPGNSVLDHLEGAGPEAPYRGPSVPFIAVPTTAGTGSEATKNAVLSVHGEAGFKKSFRDEQLVAQLALVDPELLATCPPEIIAANGMDAFTQLLESCVSINASPFTDALAWSGMEAVRDGFFAAYAGGNSPSAQAGRARMAYGSLLSGITLAQAGLGSVHGLASPLGAFFPIPHGVVCGTLVAVATEVNVRALRARAPQSAALAKYAAAGRLLAADAGLSDEAARRRLIDVLHDWTDRLQLRTLGHYGVGEPDIGRIVANARGSSMKTNPLVLEDVEIAEVVRRRL
jgi:alcohol dehydrogenase